MWKTQVCVRNALRLRMAAASGRSTRQELFNEGNLVMGGALEPSRGAEYVEDFNDFVRAWKPEGDGLYARQLAHCMWLVDETARLDNLIESWEIMAAKLEHAALTPGETVSYDCARLALPEITKWGFHNDSPDLEEFETVTPEVAELRRLLVPVDPLALVTETYRRILNQLLPQINAAGAPFPPFERGAPEQAEEYNIAAVVATTVSTLTLFFSLPLWDMATAPIISKIRTHNKGRSGRVTKALETLANALEWVKNRSTTSRSLLFAIGSSSLAFATTQMARSVAALQPLPQENYLYALEVNNRSTIAYLQYLADVIPLQPSLTTFVPLIVLKKFGDFMPQYLEFVTSTITTIVQPDESLYDYSLLGVNITSGFDVQYRTEYVAGARQAINQHNTRIQYGRITGSTVYNVDANFLTTAQVYAGAQILWMNSFYNERYFLLSDAVRDRLNFGFVVTQKEFEARQIDFELNQAGSRWIYYFTGQRIPLSFRFLSAPIDNIADILFNTSGVTLLTTTALWIWHKVLSRAGRVELPVEPPVSGNRAQRTVNALLSQITQQAIAPYSLSVRGESLGLNMDQTLLVANTLLGLTTVLEATTTGYPQTVFVFLAAYYRFKFIEALTPSLGAETGASFMAALATTVANNPQFGMGLSVVAMSSRWIQFVSRRMNLDENLSAEDRRIVLLPTRQTITYGGPLNPPISKFIETQLENLEKTASQPRLFRELDLGIEDVTAEIEADRRIVDTVLYWGMAQQFFDELPASISENYAYRDNLLRAVQVLRGLDRAVIGAADITTALTVPGRFYWYFSFGASDEELLRDYPANTWQRDILSPAYSLGKKFGSTNRFELHKLVQRPGPLFDEYTERLFAAFQDPIGQDNRVAFSTSRYGKPPLDAAIELFADDMGLAVSKVAGAYSDTQQLEGLDVVGILPVTLKQLYASHPELLPSALPPAYSPFLEIALWLEEEPVYLQYGRNRRNSMYRYTTPIMHMLHFARMAFWVRLIASIMLRHNIRLESFNLPRKALGLQDINFRQLVMQLLVQIVLPLQIITQKNETLYCIGTMYIP